MMNKQLYGNQSVLTGGGKRIKWIDTAKALGLFLVFWGHILYSGSEVASVINKAIYSFHMPMYFILSGYVMKPDGKPFIEYLKNKFNRILLPAILVYLLTLPLYFYNLDYSNENLRSILSIVFYIKGYCAYNVAIWFFFTLFQILILVKVFRLPESTNIKLIIVLASSLLLSYICYTLGWSYFSFLGFNKCLLGLSFVSFGLLLNRLRYHEFIIPLGVISVVIWIVSGVFLNTKASMYSFTLGNFWLFVISSITGSFSLFALSKLAENHDRIRQYANWTIFIVCSHYVLVTFFQWLAFRFSFEGTLNYDILSALFVILALIAYKPLCEFIDKYIPILMGNKKCKR